MHYIYHIIFFSCRFFKFPSFPINSHLSKKSVVVKSSFLHLIGSSEQWACKQDYFILKYKNKTFSLSLQIGDSLFVDLPRVRLDGGAKKFRQRWGYELINQPPVLLEEDEDQDEDDAPDTASLRETTTKSTTAVCIPSPMGKSLKEYIS